MKRNERNVPAVLYTSVTVDDLWVNVSEVFNKVREGVFGFEVEVTQGVVKQWIITPPFFRINPIASESHRNALLSDFTFYEGYLSNPYFLPVYGALNGLYGQEFTNVPLIPEEKVIFQWLFRKKQGKKWRDKAIAMYNSYLCGNDFPLEFNIGRSLQDRVLSSLDWLSSFDHVRSYIPEVEEKIFSSVFQFQFRVAIRSKEPNSIKANIVQQLKQYNGYNGIRLYLKKGIVDQFSDCQLYPPYTHQILSTKELYSLFGIDIKNDQTTQQTHDLSSVPQKQHHLSEGIQLLPSHYREDSSSDPVKVISQLADALKRVGLIKQARVYNESVTEGIRLIVVQCDIPKNKNLTHLTNKQEDIQAALGVFSLNIEQGDVPDSVRFTIPKSDPSVISLRELLEDSAFHKYRKNHALAVVAGVDEVNDPIYLSLSEMVHLLVAGTTGSGKSVFLNNLIITLLLTYSPEELQMVLIDPKMTEFPQYEGFPHVDEVITEMDQAYQKLGEVVNEMENRYRLFKGAGVKNITLYNEKATKKMPYIVCVIDEYADLKDMFKEVETHLGRLGQKARASGIHLVIATQRPSADILSSRIKAVIPSAISFNLKNNKDYMTVFGKGINNLTLLGQGDGVMKIEGQAKEFQRFQSPILAPNESEEPEVYQRIKDYLSSGVVEKESLSVKESQEEEPNELYRLKQIIAETRETRVEPLRKELGIKNTRMKDLMTQLVKEGWLVKHPDKTRGYELVASNDVLSEWKN